LARGRKEGEERVLKSGIRAKKRAAPKRWDVQGIIRMGQSPTFVGGGKKKRKDRELQNI